AETAPPARLARRVAATLKQWIGRETIKDKDGVRTIRPGDVLVLVRKRDGFVHALTRELKQHADIPVAGADRLKLAEHIAVEDLAALGRVMLLPEDDLSLAAVLKSPLFGVSEEELYSLAAERDPRESLFHRLSEFSETGEERWRTIHGQLSDWLARVDRLPVFEFFARVLAECGRRQFLARLGHEASDVLDEFLSFALEHERAGLPGMQAFLAVLETDSPEIKREMEKGRDEVRIMTVHASKGLEAPVVFLVDSGGDAVHSSHIPALRTLPLDERFGATPPAVLWVPGKEYENEITEAIKARLKEAAEEEYRRLLYVGMTRAADRLVVCGYQNPQNPTYRYWQLMVWEALEDEAVAVEQRTYTAEGEEWQGLHFCTGDEAPAAEPETERLVEEPGLPDMLRRAPSMPARLPRPLAPSGASAIIDGEQPERPLGSPLFASAGGGSSGALERGRIVHRFLQVIPGLAASEREMAARRYLARACPDWPDEEKQRLLASVFAVLDDPAFAPVFAQGSEAEVSIMGTLTLGGREHAVSGRIDRLAVTPERVLVVDYKTNRPPVLTAADVPDAYMAQLAIYRAVLAPLYPDRRIEAALIFTEAPALVPLAQDELDAALAALTPT
ncbi:MAG TPA: 3'-5' exonuclease, partial [Pararhizobium sp.]|nr:3'-5' exonuclease [Pararhizobium sp.]